MSQNQDRLMVFIDGTNVLRQLSKYIDIEFSAFKPTPTIIWLANRLIEQRVYFIAQKTKLIRKYWFASYQGSDSDKSSYMELLRNYYLEPRLYKNQKGRQEKGVDIGLATEMLINAFNHNYENCFLIAGDKDYLELVHEIKRFGANVYGGFFSEGASSELKLEFDSFHIFEDEKDKFDNLLEKYKSTILNELHEKK